MFTRPRPIPAEYVRSGDEIALRERDEDRTAVEVANMATVAFGDNVDWYRITWASYGRGQMRIIVAGHRDIVTMDRATLATIREQVRGRLASLFARIRKTA